MTDIKSRLTELSERGTHRGAEELRQRVLLDLASGGDRTRRPVPGLVVAVAVAVIAIIVIGTPLVLFGGPDESIETRDPTDTATTATTLEGAAVTMPVNGTEDVAITSDGSLWHASPDGLRRWDLATGDVTVYTELDGISSRDAHLLSVGPDDILWVVSGGHLVRFDGRWTLVNIPELEELTEWGSNVGALEMAPNGDVLLAVGHDRLIRYDGSDTTVIAAPAHAFSDPWAGSLAVAPDGMIWAVIESSSAVASFDGDSWTIYDQDDGVPWLASGIEVADDGTVWVGTTSTWGPPGETESGRPATGIGRFDGTSWTTFTTDDGLLANSGSIIIAPDGTVRVLHAALPDEYARQVRTDSLPPGVSKFDGTTWKSAGGEDEGGVAGVIAPDGTVWTAEQQSITGFRDGAFITFTMPSEVAPSRPPEEASEALPYEYPAGGSGSVTVRLSGIAGADGWRVGGVLFIGPNRMYPDSRAVGGFTTSIDSDSFSTTQVITTPSDDWVGEFPYVTDEPLGVAPGTYTIAVYVSDRLGPYSRWVPGCGDDATLYERVQTFEVGEGQAVDLDIEFDLENQNNLCSF